MQACSLRAFGTILIKSLWEGAPMCVWRCDRREKRVLCAEIWEWRELMRPEEGMGSFKDQAAAWCAKNG
eukprot:1161449-Pelagomonas_calceolata.AAC.8